VALDVLGEARIDLVEHIGAVVERPHLADRLVAHADHDAADVVHHSVDGAALVVPVLLRRRAGGVPMQVRLVLPRRVMMSRYFASCCMS
jgi:hypothetical protein